MHPAERMRVTDIELPGIVAEDRRPGDAPGRDDGAPACALGGHPDRVRVHLEKGDAERFQMGEPGVPSGEVFPRMIHQQPDHLSRQLHAPHVIECGVIEGQVLVVSTQVIEEVEPALRAAARKWVKRSLPTVVQNPFVPL